MLFKVHCFLQKVSHESCVQVHIPRQHWVLFGTSVLLKKKPGPAVRVSSSRYKQVESYYIILYYYSSIFYLICVSVLFMLVFQSAGFWQPTLINTFTVDLIRHLGVPARGISCSWQKRGKKVQSWKGWRQKEKNDSWRWILTVGLVRNHCHMRCRDISFRKINIHFGLTMQDKTRATVLAPQFSTLQILQVMSRQTMCLWDPFWSKFLHSEQGTLKNFFPTYKAKPKSANFASQRTKNALHFGLYIRLLYQRYREISGVYITEV